MNWPPRRRRSVRPCAAKSAAKDAVGPLKTKDTQMIASSMVDLIGDTPLVKLSKVTKGCAGTVVAKLELMEPACSVKDRIGVNMIVEAERKASHQDRAQ